MMKPEREKLLILKVLTWVFYSLEPVSVPILSIALAVGKEPLDIHQPHRWAIPDIDHYVSASEGLLITREQGSLHISDDTETTKQPSYAVCQFAHETVGKFFSLHPDCLLKNGMSIILEACLSFHQQWSFDLLVVSPHSHSWKQIEYPNVDGNPELVQASNAFAAWSNTWGTYVEAALREDTQIRGKIEDFLSELDAACYSDRWDGWRPLHYCANRGWSELCQILLLRGTDPSIQSRSSHSYTPLELATCSSMVESKEVRIRTIKTFLDDNRTNPNPKNHYGRTLLSRLCGHKVLDLYPWRPEVVPLLLSRHDILVNEPDEEGGTPLLYAFDYGPVETLRSLVAHPGMNLSHINIILSENIFWKIPLEERDEERLREFIEKIEVLIDHKELDLNARDVQGHTILHLASSLRITALLLSRDNFLPNRVF